MATVTTTKRNVNQGNGKSNSRRLPVRHPVTGQRIGGVNVRVFPLADSETGNSIDVEGRKLCWVSFAKAPWLPLGGRRRYFSIGLVEMADGRVGVRVGHHVQGEAPWGGWYESHLAASAADAYHWLVQHHNLTIGWRGHPLRLR
jgi:hypothetical protein